MIPGPATMVKSSEDIRLEDIKPLNIVSGLVSSKSRIAKAVKDTFEQARDSSWSHDCAPRSSHSPRNRDRPFPVSANIHGIGLFLSRSVEFSGI